MYFNVDQNLKKCTLCLEFKDISEFHFVDKAKKYKQSRCKKCNTKLSLKYPRTPAQIAEYTRSKRESLWKFLATLKDKPCHDCGMKYESYCMEFDHVGPKKYTISRMAHDKMSLSKILEEVSKTQVVCVLCHRTRTISRIKNKKGSKNWRTRRNRELYNDARRGPCVGCGRSYPVHQMDLDHTGNKVFNMSSHGGISRKKMEAEIGKCIRLCALCHRRKTFGLDSTDDAHVITHNSKSVSDH